ncbi:MAG: 2-hydroxyacyl-CoA dehydratase [Lachnospiraceae bacterium]|nr:2-hydroxyacyl-CoA dehydratase [Lachnospiraceae bacterium]
MAQSIVRLQSKLMKEYYQDFSKYARGKEPEGKVAWVTAFTPVEILEALGISYYYPESYAAVIAASGKEQEFLASSEREGLSGDCCSYAGCFNGCLETGGGPRGVPPKPDVLIATNNQCNTLPGWWNVLSIRYQVPLIVLDYPGEAVEERAAFSYVTRQHEDFIGRMEALSGRRLDKKLLAGRIENSKKSIAAWQAVLRYLPQKDVSPTLLFDDINFLITARCKEETSELYRRIGADLETKPDATKERIPLFWLGYPLWYHPARYLSELLREYRIVGANYLTWWNLDYSGTDPWEQLFAAYNYTFLNLSQKTRTRRLSGFIKDSGAACAVTLHNKSCKCDFVSSRDIEIPQAELEIDMIDRNFLNPQKAKRQLERLREALCTG